MKVGYVLKRYPRFSETFIVHEILEHEAAGLDVEIFALRPSNDPAFQELISRVRARVTYLRADSGKSAVMWSILEEAADRYPGFFESLGGAAGEAPRDVCQAADLALEIANRGVTHLHAHFATSATTVARLASSFTRVPFTFTAHAKDIFHDSVDARDLGCKLREAAATITVSDFNLAFLQQQFPRDTTRLTRVYNGLPLAAFPFTEPHERAARIVAVGRLVEKKGFEDLVDACAELEAHGRDVECRIIGAGELEPELRRRIQERSLENRVQLTGPLPLRDVLREVSAASVLAAPCVDGADGNRDGLPTILLEAMALGTPCVATDVTGIPELLSDGETGLAVPQHAPKRLAEAIEALLVHPALRVALAQRARKRIENDFDGARNAARIRAIFADARTPTNPVS